MDLWELDAREQIRDIVARYNAGGDSGRWSDVLALFTDDAVMEIVGRRVYAGRDGIRDLFTGAARPSSSGGSRTRIWHHISTHVIDLEGEQAARGRCYFAVLTESGLDHWGRYRDVYRREGNRWLFASRRVTVDATVPGGWAERNLGRQ